MKRYILNGSERGCFDCGKPYLLCRCYDKPEPVVNHTPLYAVGQIVRVSDDNREATIVEVLYPIYTEFTSYNGAPVITTNYRVLFGDSSEDWFGQAHLTLA